MTEQSRVTDGSQVAGKKPKVLSRSDDIAAYRFAQFDNTRARVAETGRTVATDARRLGDVAMAEIAEEQADKAEHGTERDNNTKLAGQHKDEHLDEYIETARQEAEAQGIHINLEQPKE